MDVVLKYRGRMIRESDLPVIRALIEENPTASRRELSRRLCEAWNWVQSNGALCDMVCRGLMLVLERAGYIALPPVKWRPPAGGAAETKALGDRHHADRGHPERSWSVGVPAGEADAGRAIIQCPHRASSLSGVHAASRRTTQVHGVCRRPAGRMFGMVFGGAALGTARPLHWLEPGSAAAQHPVYRIQLQVSGVAVGPNSLFSVPHFGPDGGAGAAGLGMHLRASHLLPGNFRRSPTEGHLLPGSQLD